jgi:hypothetical protein
VFRKQRAPDLIRGGNRFSDKNTRKIEEDVLRNTRKTKDAVRSVAGVLLALSALVGLTSCDLDQGTGYVEIKAVPPAAAVALYLDAVKLEPLRNGNAVLRQKVGTAKLQTDEGGQLAVLCNIEVKKNRITSVTVSVMSRQPRCLCGRMSVTGSTASRACIG